MYASGGWGGARYRAGGLTSQFALAEANGTAGIVCDHAAPPVGYRYVQSPGTTGPCNLVLRPIATTGGSGNTNGSGTGSNTGTGTGTGTTVTPGGGGTTTTPAAGTGLALSPELTKALWIAAAIWVASKVFKG